MYMKTQFTLKELVGQEGLIGENWVPIYGNNSDPIKVFYLADLRRALSVSKSLSSLPICPAMAVFSSALRVK